MSDGVFAGEIDPEIAELMGIEVVEDKAASFDDTISEKKELAIVDLSREAFKPVTKYEEDKANPLFSSKNFYMSVLSGGGEFSKNLHSILSLFLNTKNSKEKSMYRDKLISAFWNLARNFVLNCSSLNQSKRFFLRYGFLLPTIVSSEQREMIGKIVVDNNSEEPFYYLDEWFKEVGAGNIRCSSVDEINQGNKSYGAKIQERIDKEQGNCELYLSQIKKEILDIENGEIKLREKVKTVSSHQILDEGFKSTYDPGQKEAIIEIMNVCRLLSKKDKMLIGSLDFYKKAKNNLKELKDEESKVGDSSSMDTKILEQEFNVVRQMIKMVIGRHGNHLPFLMEKYFYANIKDIATRENVIMEFAAVENIDRGLFKRTFKNHTNRIVPYVILVPGYGEKGICWEPFERFNRATSRGRVAIPIFPKDLKIAVIAVAADLRWQVAKEKAQHHWMEEGLTGHYYQWFVDKKIRGDIRKCFIQDYILWITKESEGTQKLNKEVRSIFWRNIPFSKELRDVLRNKGFVYSELHKKDINRSLSDGY